MNRSCMLILCMLIYTVNGMEKDWNAHKYSKNSDLQYNAAMRGLSNIEFKGNEKVIDIGCGDGKVTAKIAKLVPQGSVIGVDKSENQIKHAQNNHRLGNLSFDVMDISDEMRCPFTGIPYHGFDHQFNLVTAFSSLSWIKDQPQAFKNIAFLLAYEGKLRAGLAHEDSPYLRARFGMCMQDKWKQFFIDYEIPFYPSNEKKVREMLEIAGLKEELIAKIEAPHMFKNRQEFIDWMSAIPAQIDRIPQERHEEFFNDIIDEYLKEVPQEEDGSIKVSISALAVRAEFTPSCW